MQAKALITAEDQTFSLHEVVLPDVGPGQVMVKVAYSAISIGTEFALIRGKLNWGDFPLCTGYQATGVIQATGPEVRDFQIGNKVYVRGSESMTLTDGTPVSAVSGTHASHILCTEGTDHGVGHMPSDADMATASMFVMPAVGLNGVDMANPRMADTVVIYGCGLIGLGALAACVHRGCRVIAVDINPKPLEMAEAFGADHLVHGATEDVEKAVHAIADTGAHVVFECSGVPASINKAIRLCRAQGKFIWLGNYGEAPVSLDFLTPHEKRLQMLFPCDDGLEPCRRAVIKNMALGSLPWETCITHRIGAREAPDMFSRINRGDEDVIGVVIDWQDESLSV